MSRQPATSRNHQPVLTEPAAGRLKAYVVSDVHLNNHPWDQRVEAENPRRRNFREFLAQLNATLLPDDRLKLILNGDILDITGSWFEAVMPWEKDAVQVESHLLKVVSEIVTNNAATMAELTALIEHPNTEIIYVYGNHDGLLTDFPSSHEIIRDGITKDPDARQRIRFTASYESDELELYIEHGHLFDPFNHAGLADPPLGDVINILIVNRFVDMVVDRLRENGYSVKFIANLHTRLHDIEYLRPLSLVPVWMQTMANHYRKDPENRGKRETVDVIIMDVVEKILQDEEIMRLLTERLRLPKSLLRTVTRLILRLPAILPLVSFITTKLVRRTHSNQYQYKMALRLHKEKGYRLITFGHTHIPGVMALSENAYYFNTGSWKPVINLFKFGDERDPLDLEQLLPEVPFNKVERCGILRIEKLPHEDHAQFALQTIQSGLSG